MKSSPNIIINAEYLSALSRIFSPIVLDNLAQKGYSGYLSEVCRNSGLIKRLDFSITLGDFLDQIYKFLFKNYRNEYIYKNVIADKILLGKHSLNTSQMLTEFRVGRCKADAVILNGTSTVYEIKSEFDSFVRLEKQIQAYFQVFDKINVITTANNAIKLESILPSAAGILVLTDRSTISTFRESESNKKNIKPEILFDSLRKTEYTQIIKEYFGSVPEVPNTRIYKDCKKLFCEIPSEEAHDLTIKILMNRSNSKLLQEFIDKAPLSLLAYAINICKEKTKMQKLMARFNSSIGSILVSELA